jgi:hypothetical protein
MYIQQLSLFVENKPGGLVTPLRVLAERGINLVSLCLADTRTYGILRLIVEDWQTAKDALTEAGLVVNTTEVLAVEVDDRPGGLLDLLRIIEASDTSIEYMYAFPSGWSDRAVMVFRFDDTARATVALRAAGVSPMASLDLFRRVGR